MHSNAPNLRRSRSNNKSGGDQKRNAYTNRNGDRRSNKSDKGRKADISKQVCYAFKKNGKCKLGKKCPRKHVTSQMVRVQAAPDVAYDCMREPNEQQTDESEQQLHRKETKCRKLRGRKSEVMNMANLLVVHRQNVANPMKFAGITSVVDVDLETDVGTAIYHNL